MPEPQAPSRRHVVNTISSGLAAPVMLAAGGACWPRARNRRAACRALPTPTKPPFPEQRSSPPGLARDMRPKPGEDSYRGSRLVRAAASS